MLHLEYTNCVPQFISPHFVLYTNNAKCRFLLRTGLNSWPTTDHAISEYDKDRMERGAVLISSLIFGICVIRVRKSLLFHMVGRWEERDRFFHPKNVHRPRLGRQVMKNRSIKHGYGRNYDFCLVTTQSKAKQSGRRLVSAVKIPFFSHSSSRSARHLNSMSSKRQTTGKVNLRRSLCRWNEFVDGREREFSVCTTRWIFI